MTPPVSARRTLRSDEGGATLVEFAMILPIFCGMLCGFLDFAQWTYVKAGATGAIEQVARSAGVGGPAVDPTVFEAQTESLIKGIAKSATFVWERKSYYQFSGIDKPEKLTDDKNGNGSYDAGDCWLDTVSNAPAAPAFDATPGENSIGGADDILFYKVTVAFVPLIPITSMFPGVPVTRSVSAATIVKRQPFAAQTVPAIRC